MKVKSKFKKKIPSCSLEGNKIKIIKTNNYSDYSIYASEEDH